MPRRRAMMSNGEAGYGLGEACIVPSAVSPDRTSLYAPGKPQFGRRALERFTSGTGLATPIFPDWYQYSWRVLLHDRAGALLLSSSLAPAPCLLQALAGRRAPPAGFRKLQRRQHMYHRGMRPSLLGWGPYHCRRRCCCRRSLRRTPHSYVRSLQCAPGGAHSSCQRCPPRPHRRARGAVGSSTRRLPT